VFPFAGVVVALVAGYAVFAWFPALNQDASVGEGIRAATVATDVLNVRSGPGTDAEILGGLGWGTTVEVVGEPELGFVPIRFGEGYGWLAEMYLDFGDEARPAAWSPVQVEDAVAADVPVNLAEPVVTVEPPAPAPAIVPEITTEPAERWIDIDRSTATVSLYVGDVSQASFVGKIGRDPASDGFYSTAIGTYHVYSMNKGLSPTPFAEDTYLTDWVGFDPVRKNGIHSPVRDEDGNEKSWQNATTLGCVRLEAAAAESVFAFAEIGMRVEVHD
jgi:uncharacterized protein YraI